MPGSQRCCQHLTHDSAALLLCTAEWSILHSAWWDIRAVHPRRTFVFCVFIFQPSKKGLEIKVFLWESENSLFLSVVRHLVAWLAENRFTLTCWQNPTWLNLFAALGVPFWMGHQLSGHFWTSAEQWCFGKETALGLLCIGCVWDHRAEWISCVCSTFKSLGDLHGDAQKAW